jgi:hypothetical protein
MIRAYKSLHLLSFMATPVTITKFSRALADFINFVYYRRESFLLLRGNKPVAEVRPVAKNFSFSDLSILLNDGNSLTRSESDDFLEDIRTIRAESTKDKGKNKWE